MMLAPPAPFHARPVTGTSRPRTSCRRSTFVQRGHVRVVAGTPVPEHVDELSGVALEVVVLPEGDLATFVWIGTPVPYAFSGPLDPAGML